MGLHYSVLLGDGLRHAYAVVTVMMVVVVVVVVVVALELE